MSSDNQTEALSTPDITDGIDIGEWEVPVSEDTETKITFSAWDFAGQTVYYNTHQVWWSNLQYVSIQFYRQTLFKCLHNLTDYIMFFEVITPSFIDQSSIRTLSECIWGLWTVSQGHLYHSVNGETIIYDHSINSWPPNYSH